MPEVKTDELVTLYSQNKHIFERFLRGVADFFVLEPLLNQGSLPVIHSIKTRLKDPDHLREKISRKLQDGKVIDAGNFFDVLTDLAGVRILHLHRKQFEIIHECIMMNVGQGDWELVEKPVAYTWDPEIEDYFKGFDIRTSVKESFYTSVHYVIKPPSNPMIKCEIQVRNLFEEVWGEIDHAINYPNPSQSVSCREQIRVLSKLVGAGSRLADSIFSEHTRSAL